jgi:hypothetical protein
MINFKMTMNLYLRHVLINEGVEIVLYPYVVARLLLTPASAPQQEAENENGHNQI